MERTAAFALLGMALAVLPLLLAACRTGENAAQEGGHAIRVARQPVQLGDARVSITVHETGAPGLTFVNMHDDENTAVEAARQAIRQHGGRLVELQHEGTRNLSFALEGTTYTVDPNRIFTDAGAEATLRDLGPYSDAALAATRRFAGSFLDAIDLQSAGVVVTAHNNTEGRYSARSYTAGGEYKSEARAAHLAPGTDPDDFFFVTDEPIYDALRRGSYSVVLQDNAGMTDDGSLSVYSGQQGLPYVNVEAQHGHLEAQVDMMNDLRRVLADLQRLPDRQRL